jgi:hypothetical protein
MHFPVPHVTADNLLVAPTPTMAPEIACEYLPEFQTTPWMIIQLDLLIQRKTLGRVLDRLIEKP